MPSSPRTNYYPEPAVPNEDLGGPEVLEVVRFDKQDGKHILAWVEMKVVGLSVIRLCSFTPSEFVDTKGAQGSVNPDKWTELEGVTSADAPEVRSAASPEAQNSDESRSVSEWAKSASKDCPLTIDREAPLAEVSAWDDDEDDWTSWLLSMLCLGGR